MLVLAFAGFYAYRDRQPRDPGNTPEGGAKNTRFQSSQERLLHATAVACFIDIPIFITTLVVGILGLTLLSSSIPAAAAYGCLSISSLNALIWTGVAILTRCN